MDLGQPEFLASGQQLVVGRIEEGERDDPLGDEVAPVNSGERLRKDRLHPELLGGQRDVFAAGTLPVAVAGNDEAAVRLRSPLGKVGIDPAETKRAIAATFERSAITSAPSGERSPVETSSPRTMRTRPRSSWGRGVCGGGGWMLGPRTISIR